MCTVWPSHSKWLRVEQWICIKFCIKLEHSSTETMQMILKATYGQLVIGSFTTKMCPCSCITAHAEFFLAKHQITQVTQPSTAQIWHHATSGFSQNSNHLWKGRDFRSLTRFRKIWRGSWWQLGELCEVPRCLLWRGLRCHCPVYNVSYLFSCIFFKKCLFFILHVQIPSRQTSYVRDARFSGCSSVQSRKSPCPCGAREKYFDVLNP